MSTTSNRMRHRMAGVVLVAAAGAALGSVPLIADDSPPTEIVVTERWL